MNARKRIGILISGRGSNMAALIEAAAAPDFPAEIALVLSNRPNAAGLDFARAADLPTDSIDHRDFLDDRGAHEAAIDARLQASGVEIVCLAGYLRRLTPFLVGRWAGNMLNIHPSLLPSFPGLDTHRRALEAGVVLHGCTVHLVTEKLDEGPILAQAAVPVFADDDEARLAARVLVQEHAIYPMALRHRIDGSGGRTKPDASLYNLVERNIRL